MNNVAKYDLDNLCTGCTACFNVCPKNAISIEENRAGFYNPKINEQCVHCGLCLDVCQINSELNLLEPVEILAGQNMDDKIRLKSSSGGLFTALCKGMSESKKNVCIVGAAWNNMKLDHIIVSGSDFHVFVGSKYVQSYLGTVFSEIERILKEGQLVVFSGTGCQCYGLKKYIISRKINSDKLYIVDIICHGVPSAKLWRDYLTEIERVVGKRIVDYSFRDKSISWRGINPRITTEFGDNVSCDNLVKSYGKLFGNLSLNSVCYNCRFTSTHRCGDLTLGDFWGIEKTYGELNDGKGTSICLVNSKKGKELVQVMEKEVRFVRVIDDSYVQPQLSYPTKPNYRYEKFKKDYVKHGYLYVAQKYTMQSKLYVFLRDMYRRVKK